MIPVKYIDPEDLPLYAMQLLTPEEMEELTSSLHHSVEGRKVLAEFYADLSLLAHTAETHEPSAVARQRLMKHIAREKKPVPASPLDQYAAPIEALQPRLVPSNSSLFDDEPVEKSFGAKAMPWVGWLLAAGLAAFSFLEYQQTELLKTAVAQVKAQDADSILKARAASELLDAMKDPLAVHATLRVAADAKPLPTGRVLYAADRGSLLFVGNNLETLPASKTYELWLIPADGTKPIPAGVFRPDEHGYATVAMPELLRGVQAKAFGITVEDGAGSDVPTAPVLLQGAAS
jgi:hypothetical protein